MTRGFYLDINANCASEFLFGEAPAGEERQPVAVVGPRFWRQEPAPRNEEELVVALKSQQEPGFTLLGDQEWALRKGSFRRLGDAVGSAPPEPDDNRWREFLVRYETNLDADSAHAAARTTFRWMLCPASFPPCLTVVDMATGESVEVDLAKGEPKAGL